jgi:hypothetical protein
MLNGADSTDSQVKNIKPSVFDDLDSLRIDPDEGLNPTVEHLIHIPVRKPGKTWFIRAHPNTREMYFLATIFEDKEGGRECYFVLPAARPFLEGVSRLVQLTLCVNVQGIHFLWPCAAADSVGANAWNTSARAAMDLARSKWVRVVPDIALGAYRVMEAKSVLGEPKWPDLEMSTILKVAFGDRIIDGPEHPIVRTLQGLS